MPQKTASKKNSSKPGSKATGTKNRLPLQVIPRNYLSDCASDYTRCLANPFTGPLACVPGPYPIMTRKLRVFIKSSFTIGSQGAGFVWCNPMNSLVNNHDCVNFTGADYASAGGYAGVANGAGTTLIQTARSNSEYDAAAFGESPGTAQGRVVSCGLRIRYSGTELNRAGTVVAFSDPTHSTINGMTPANISLEVQSRRFPVTRDWTTVLYMPVIAEDYQLINVSNALTAANVAAGTLSWYMGFQVIGAVVATSFEWEMFTVFEVNGRAVRGMTPSHSDPTGLAATMNVSNSAAPVQGPAEVHEKSFLSKVTDNLKFAISHGADVYNYSKTAVNAGQDLYSLYKGGAPSNTIRAAEQLLALM